MSEELEGEVVDVEEVGQELVPHSAGAPATLFRTDDPVEIVERATAVATALSDVLKKQGLTTRIGQKDHVRVEGWTLCGSMLGVFPVVEWTRKLDNGWEARVEARTRDGAVVGAAEAECLNTENRWKTADDYAIRSMAQTRAMSKALRAPLGFVVALAGFDPTPEEEAHREPPAPAREFDIELDLQPGAISGANAPKEIAAQLDRFDPSVDWGATMIDALLAKYGKRDRKDLDETETKDFWRRLSNSVWWIEQAAGAGDFPPVPTDMIAAGFAYGFSDAIVEVVYKEKLTPAGGDAVISAEEGEALDKSIAAEAAQIEFGGPSD